MGDTDRTNGAAPGRGLFGLLGLSLEEEVVFMLLTSLMRPPGYPALGWKVHELLADGVSEELVRRTYDRLTASLPRMTLLAALTPPPTWEDVLSEAAEAAAEDRAGSAGSAPRPESSA